MPCSRAPGQDMWSLWCCSDTWLLIMSFSAAVSPAARAALKKEGMMLGNWKIRSKSVGCGKLCIRCHCAFTASATPVNNATGHLTPFPSDKLVYIGGTIRTSATFLPSLRSSLHHRISLSCIHRAAFAAAAPGTLKCNVHLHSQLLKWLPLSPSVPFPFLSFSIHGRA